MRRSPPKKRVGQATGPRRLEGEILDVAATAALLGVTEKCIRARVTRQLLPHRIWGSRVCFLRAELMAFLTKLDGCTVDQALAGLKVRSGGPA
jgi:hypothetical protein